MDRTMSHTRSLLLAVFVVACAAVPAVGFYIWAERGDRLRQEKVQAEIASAEARRPAAGPSIVDPRFVVVLDEAGGYLLDKKRGDRVPGAPQRAMVEAINRIAQEYESRPSLTPK